MPIKDPNKRREYMARYYRSHRKELLEKKRNYDAEHREQKRAYNKKYREKHSRECDLEYFRHYRRNNRQKIRAQDRARRHTELGSECEICRSTENLERHHPDYSKPLEVITLCHQCHMNQHVESNSKPK